MVNRLVAHPHRARADGDVRRARAKLDRPDHAARDHIDPAERPVARVRHPHRPEAHGNARRSDGERIPNVVGVSRPDPDEVGRPTVPALDVPGPVRVGGENGPGLETGKFLAPHGLALDSRGSIYVGEVGVTNWKTSFPDKQMPTPLRCLQKLAKVA